MLALLLLVVMLVAVEDNSMPWSEREVPGPLEETRQCDNEVESWFQALLFDIFDSDKSLSWSRGIH